MKAISVAAICAAVWAAWAAPAGATDWPQWRGPFFNGSSDETNLPATFGQTENVIWKVDLPGRSGATPIVSGKHVFVSSQEDGSDKLWAMCFNAADGSLLWKRPMGTGFTNKMGNTGASPSPIADGKQVVFYYGTGELAAFDLAGSQRWRRNIAADHGKFEYIWNYASTGLLYEGKLYIPVLHADHKIQVRDISYLLCVDPATGKDLWKTPRVTDAEGESRQAFVTPTPHRGPEGWQVLLLGGDYLTGHSPATGKMLWKSPGYNTAKNKWWRVVSSVTAAGTVAVGCSPKGGYLFAVRTQDVGGQKAGQEIWRRRENSPDVTTPLIYDGKLFILDGRKKVLLCMAPETGEVLWQGDLPAKAVFQASPTGADGKIYCINLEGEVVVASAGDTFKVLHTTKMDSGARSTISVSGGRLYLRTQKTLYCIGKKN